MQPSPPPAVRPPQQPTREENRLPPMHSTRPILAIDTTPTHANGNGHVSMPRSGIVNGHGSSQVLTAAALAELSPKTSMSSSKPRRHGPTFTCTLTSIFSSGSQRQRAKKITVACNFCRCKFRLVLLFYRGARSHILFGRSAEAEVRRRQTGMRPVLQTFERVRLQRRQQTPQLCQGAETVRQRQRG